MAPGPDLMLQAAQSQVTAAWVQAWGSIGAILAAALIAGWQGRSDARRRKNAERMVSRDLALLVDRPVSDWADHARGWLRTMDDPSGIGEWAVISQFADDPDQLAPPAQVMEFNGRFRDFGKAARSLQAAVLAWNMIDASRGRIREVWNRASVAQDIGDDGVVLASSAIRHYALAVIEAADAMDRVRSGRDHA